MRTRISFRTLLFATAAVPVILSNSAALAQSTGATGIEAVIVTAERRAEPLFNVPATITAVSGETLNNLGITDMKSIVAMIPNAVLPDDPENFETYINIRGIRQADINAEPNFGLYRNGMYAGGERANLGAQIDIDRVEVLSGPQSGLYGRDAVGGVFNIIFKTASTTDGLNGYAIGSYGRYNRSELQGAVNIPLMDNFAVRATGWWINQNEGQLYNSFLDQYIDQNRDIGGRLSARWDASDRLNVTWMGEFQDKHGPSLTAYAPNGIGAVFNVRCCGLPVQGPETLTTIQEDTPNTEHWQQLYLSQDVNYDTKTDLGTFELLTAYRNYHLSLQEDQDHTAIGPTASYMAGQSIQYRNEGMHNFYGELVWKSPDNQPFTWIAGVDYFNETFRFTRVFDGNVDFNLLNQFPFGGSSFTAGNLFCSFLMAGEDGHSFDGGCEGTPGVAPGLPGAGASGSFPYFFPNIGVQNRAFAWGAPGSGIDTKSESAFVSGTYHVTSAFSIRGDLRWDQTTKSLNYIQGPVDGYGETALGASYLDPLYYQLFPPFHSQQTDTFVNLSPSATAQYMFSDTANMYATFSTGFRAGSFNLGTSTPAYLPYGSERANNYEIGTKTMWLDGTLGVNADVFYMTQSHMLESQADHTEAAIFFGYYLTNCCDARTYGAELTAAYQPLPWLSFGGALGWLDGMFTGGTTNGVSVKGQQIDATRHWTLNLSSSINTPVGPNMNFVGDVNYRYEEGGFLPSSTTPYETLNKIDLDAGLSFGNTRVVAFVDNVTNDIIPQFIYFDGIENVSEGRTYGIRVEEKF